MDKLVLVAVNAFQDYVMWILMGMGIPLLPGQKTCRTSAVKAGLDCNDSCPTCFPGSTATTPSQDSLDQDCDGVLNNNVAPSKSCLPHGLWVYRPLLEAACDDWCPNNGGTGGQVQANFVDSGCHGSIDYSFETCGHDTRVTSCGTFMTGTLNCNCDKMYQ